MQLLLLLFVRACEFCELFISHNVMDEKLLQHLDATKLVLIFVIIGIKRIRGKVKACIADQMEGEQTCIKSCYTLLHGM